MTHEQIYNEALAAAKAAIAAEAPEDPRAFDCGFAWVIVRPARGAFVNWCKENGHGSLAYGGGWQFWCPGEFRGQSVRIHRAAAVAFAEALQRAGLRAEASSRLD